MEHKFKEELKTSFDFDTPKGVHENPFAALVLGINNYTENNNQ
jgi:hypothetical protein